MVARPGGRCGHALPGVVGCVWWRAWPSFTAAGMAVSSLEALEPVGFGAMMLGLAVVGIDQATLCALRAHEHAHARQFEAVGTVFFAGLRVVEFVASRQRPQRPRQQLF